MAHDHDAHSALAQSGQPSERCFLSAPTRRSNFRALLGGLGSAALGAATWATWMRETPMEGAQALFAIGVVGVVVSIVMGDPSAAPLRVGDAGVAVDRGGSEPDRIGWYEVDRVRFDGVSVIVESKSKRIVAPVETHEGAAGWIVQEALARVPKKVEIAEEQATMLLRATDDHGHIVVLQRAQVAGRRCRASGTVIAFEQDAVLCKRCGEVYDRQHVPGTCMACEAHLDAAHEIGVERVAS